MSNKEYIEREFAMQILEEYMPKDVDSDKIRETTKELYLMAKDHAKSYLSVIPAADVVEVRRGKNISNMHPVDEFICSECGLIMRDLTKVRIDEDEGDELYYEFEFKYCPNCGAKIDDE